jgi:hypothetical protein
MLKLASQASTHSNSSSSSSRHTACIFQPG